MRRYAPVSAAVLLVVLLLWGIGRRHDPLVVSRTTWGTHPVGHRAVYELLGELGIPRSRSHVPAEELPEGVTIWWLEPDDLCRGVEEGRLADGGAGPWRGLPWLRSGGTGVLFLPPHPVRCLVEAELDGEAVPWRSVDAEGGGAGAPEPVGDGLPSAPDSFVAVEGALLPRPRELPEPLLVFRETAQGAAQAATEAGPFVVEQRLGQGRLVWVADVRPLRNAHLDAGDAAPFAVDLVQRFGAPRFDEREHGLLPARSSLRYLAGSAALPALLGVVALTGLFAFAGHALPRRRLEEEPEAAPTLESFVTSLGSLYARSRDHAAVLARYRELTEGRLRRGLQLPWETTRERLVAALVRRGVPAARVRALLAEEIAVGSRAELLVRARELDALVQEVCG